MDLGNVASAAAYVSEQAGSRLQEQVALQALKKSLEMQTREAAALVELLDSGSGGGTPGSGFSLYA